MIIRICFIKSLLGKTQSENPKSRKKKLQHSLNDLTTRNLDGFIKHLNNNT